MLTALALSLALAPAPAEIKISIDGKERMALVVAPAKITKPAPVVFAYHGHGGNARYSVNKFKFQDTWSDVICVFPQGLPTKTPNDLQGKRNGWESTRNESNKDLKFADALLKEVKKRYSVNEKQLFAMGHSNGATMTFMLWAMRPNVYAGYGPCSAPGARGVTVPKPAFIQIGESDEIVNVDLMHWSLSQIKQVNGSKSPGKSLGKHLTEFTGKAPLQTYIYPGGHSLPDDVVPLMAKFFKRIAQDQK